MVSQKKFSSSNRLTVRIAMKLNRKKMKNWDGSRLRPERKYRMMLKQTAMMNLIGMSETIPAKASAKG
jgi:hypothetical protein